MDKDRGKIIGVRGQIVEVEFAQNPPNLHDLLILEDDKTTKWKLLYPRVLQLSIAYVFLKLRASIEEPGL